MHYKLKLSNSSQVFAVTIIKITSDGIIFYALDLPAGTIILSKYPYLELIGELDDSQTLPQTIRTPPASIEKLGMPVYQPL